MIEGIVWKRYVHSQESTGEEDVSDEKDVERGLGMEMAIGVAREFDILSAG